MKEKSILSSTKQTLRNFIKSELNDYKFTFVERNTRMDYGHLGNILKDGKTIIMIYGSSFYIHDKNFGITGDLVNLIRNIQLEYKDLTRDENNNIVLTHN